MSNGCEPPHEIVAAGGMNPVVDPARAGIAMFNGGFSALYLAGFATVPLGRIIYGRNDRGTTANGRPIVGDGVRRLEDRTVEAPVHAAAAGAVIEPVERGVGLATAAAMRHDSVHGRGDLDEPALITPEMLDHLRRIAPLDPKHVPGDLARIESLGQAIPADPRVAGFHVAFLARAEGMTSGRFHRRVNRESGLHGVSETNAHLRDLPAHQRASPRPPRRRPVRPLHPGHTGHLHPPAPAPPTSNRRCTSLTGHRPYIARRGDDMPEISGRRWGARPVLIAWGSGVTLRPGSPLAGPADFAIPVCCKDGPEDLVVVRRHRERWKASQEATP